MTTLTYSLNDASLSLTSEVVTTTGGLVSFTKWVKEKGFNMKDKGEKKLANARYSQLKKEFYRKTNQIISQAVADDRLNAKKAKPVFNKDGEFVGLDAAFRVPTKMEMNRDAAAAETIALAMKDTQIEELKAALAAALAKGNAIEEVAAA